MSAVQHRDPVGRPVTVLAVVGTEALTVWMFDTVKDQFELIQVSVKGVDMLRDYLPNNLFLVP